MPALRPSRRTPGASAARAAGARCSSLPRGSRASAHADPLGQPARRRPRVAGRRPGRTPWSRTARRASGRAAGHRRRAHRARAHPGPHRGTAPSWRPPAGASDRTARRAGGPRARCRGRDHPRRAGPGAARRTRRARSRGTASGPLLRGRGAVPDDRILSKAVGRYDCIAVKRSVIGEGGQRSGAWASPSSPPWTSRSSPTSGVATRPARASAASRWPSCAWTARAWRPRAARSARATSTFPAASRDELLIDWRESPPHPGGPSCPVVVLRAQDRTLGEVRRLRALSLMRNQAQRALQATADGRSGPARG